MTTISVPSIRLHLADATPMYAHAHARVRVPFHAKDRQNDKDNDRQDPQQKINTEHVYKNRCTDKKNSRQQPADCKNACLFVGRQKPTPVRNACIWPTPSTHVRSVAWIDDVDDDMP